MVSLLVFGSLAAPTQPEMHSLHYYKRKVPFYYPKLKARWFKLAAINKTPVSDEKAVKIGLQKLSSELGVPESELQVERWFRGSAANVMHIYAQRIINGVPVDNQKASVFVKNGQVVSWSSSIDPTKSKLAGKSIISLQEAEEVATKQFGLSRDNTKAKKVYIEIPNGKLVYAYQFQLRNISEWIQVSVDSATKQVVQVIDYSSDATFRAIKLPKNDPNENFGVVVNPEKAIVSPEGWNSNGNQKFSGTEGNNVRSLMNGKPVNGDRTGRFGFAEAPKQQPDFLENQRAAAINSFYGIF